ncbi:hypothetical protein Agub_g2529, partial [Astrephomene gubernaculifera]
MDKVFLSGLAAKESRKGGSSSHTSSSPRPPPPSTSTPLGYGVSGSALLSPHPSSSSSPLLYSGRPAEHLLFDAASADLVLLVADDGNPPRPVPVHRDVLLARNPGGYFPRLLADPRAFPEYCGPLPPGVAGALEGKPVIRRTHWPWSVASVLLAFMYRDCCEVPWVQLPAVRQVAQEIELRSLTEAIDHLLDPQHLLPWTVADMRAAAAALRKGPLEQAAERYLAAMRLAGVDESTRMASFVYHARQARPTFAPSSLPALPSATPADPDNNNNNDNDDDGPCSHHRHMHPSTTSTTSTPTT